MSAQTVKCPACGKEYRLPERLPRQPRIKLRCLSCRLGFTIPSPDVGDAPPEPSREREPAAAGEAAPLSGEERKRRERRARRLARVIVQDLLSGQRERRDRALEQGSLLLEFGDDVRRAWIAYQEKAGAEIAQNTNFFRDALNEILADGQPIF